MDELRGSQLRPPHLSVSSIQDWIRCPLLWYGRRVARWPQPPSCDLELGKAMHLAFAAHHAGADPELALLKAWADVSPTDPPAGSLQIAINALRMYRASNPPQPEDVSEKFFQLRIPRLEIPFVGYFDLVRGRELHEFKTGRARWGQKRVDSEFQASAYWWAFGQLYKGSPERMIYHLVTTSPGASVYSLETTRTTADLLKFQDDARRVYAEIQNGELRRGCKDGWCQFPEQCCAWD